MIITPRLKLVNFTTLHAEALLLGDREFENFLGVTIPLNWLEERWAIETFYNEIKNDPKNIKWGAYLIIHSADNKLIGCCGFKGKPKEDGSVEIGYEIQHDYRGKGLAKEVVKALIEFAFICREVTTVFAHTLAEENASGSILKSSGFSFVKQYNDPEDSEVWQWELRREVSL